MFGRPEYPEGLFDGWCKPTTNVKLKKVYVSEASAPPAHSAGLDDIPEFDEEDSFDAVRLPNAAKSVCSDSEDESNFSQDQGLPEATEQLLSPPPTDLSEAVDTPPQPRHPKKMVVISDDDQTPEPTLPLPPSNDAAPPQTRRPGQLKRNLRKVVISEDEHTPEPTIPLQEAVETPPNARRESPNARRGQPRRTPEVLLTRRRPRQLETPGPSDSATPGTTDAGTPDSTPAPPLRKSTRIRRARSRLA